jgi:hypothetical protein
MPDILQMDVVDSLRTKGESGLLDAIDTLRSQGIGSYVSLPQLIVCGDQSSGKSSVLEAISGIPFSYQGQSLHEVRYRSDPTSVSESRGRSVHFSCEDHDGPSTGLYAGFHDTITASEDFPGLIEKAKKLMGLAETANACAADVLRAEISGPDRPHLILVDLPGLIHTETKQQTAADKKLVLNMVECTWPTAEALSLQWFPQK